MGRDGGGNKSTTKHKKQLLNRSWLTCMTCGLDWSVFFVIILMATCNKRKDQLPRLHEWGAKQHKA
jgi:hypothetical protein